jgi:hypothetical protein
MSSDETMPQIYTIDKDGNQLAFNERPFADGRVRLGFHAGASGTYTISLNGENNDVQLYDAENEKTTSLSAPYQFNVYSPGIYDNRFTLLFSKSNSTAIQETQPALTSVSVVSGGVVVKAEIGTEISVYRVDGSLFGVTTAKTESTPISLSAGLYIIRVGNKSFKSLIY